MMDVGFKCLEPELWDAQQDVAWLMPRRCIALLTLVLLYACSG